MQSTTYEETRTRLVDMARCVLGPERVAALEPQLAERARHLWIVDSFPLDDTDEPELPNG